jgi:hypothetical protein
MVFIDACHSGGVTGGQAVDNELLARVLKESNALVFTASRGSQYSLESASVQHGFFAYSIIKSLREGRSGTINMLELSSDIIRETKSLSNDRQQPQLSAMSFEDFPIAVRRSSTSTASTSSGSSSSSPATPFKPIQTTPPPSAPPPRPTTPPQPSASDIIWGAVTDLAVWGLGQLFR